ncbi:MAG TPA: acetyl-CoA carboxylase biotin carboxyl carrier protein subunit [Capillimicrobium sp.]|jgi:acetyl-CoA carboxylase biotin carboxyl carrier protein
MERLEAPVTGTVWKLACAVGDAVDEGDVLVILESMKMEIPVEAESDGRVAAVLCAEGEAVEDGQVLVEVEPA